MKVLVGWGKYDSKDTPCIVLIRSQWNDYGIKSTFSVFFVNKRGGKVEVGEVKIIKSNSGPGEVEIDSGAEGLSDAYCSVGQSKKYYENLFSLGEFLSRDVLESLKDCSLNKSLYDKFFDEQYFSQSLFRFSDAERAYVFAREKLEGVVKKSGDGTSFSFRCNIGSYRGKIFDFEFESSDGFPGEINVLIGRNGTGKTTVLSELAKSISGFGIDDPNDLKGMRSRFKGERPRFGGVIVISYSAFDSFEIPGKDRYEVDRMDSEGSIFGYRYCGLRKYDDSGRQVIKTNDELSDEFKKTIVRINEKGRHDVWLRSAEILLKDLSFVESSVSDIQNNFTTLSSGHKVLFLIVSSLAEQIEEGSLLLLDEPETHLHPSLIASLMHVLRLYLKEFRSYGIVATHSPVVLQETPSRFVKLVERVDVEGAALSPRIECFGEELSTINEVVFGVSFEQANFYGVLQGLANRGYSNKTVEKWFGRRLGFTARSFLQRGEE